MLILKMLILMKLKHKITRCPDTEASAAMVKKSQKQKKAGDSLGGIVTCLIRGVPAGLGAPVFDRIEADLAKGMLSLPPQKVSR